MSRKSVSCVDVKLGPANPRKRREILRLPKVEARMSLYNQKQWRRERDFRTLDTVSRIHTFQACAFSRSATPPLSSLSSGSSKVRRLGWISVPRDAEDGPVSLIPPQWQGRKAGCP